MPQRPSKKKTKVINNKHLEANENVRNYRSVKENCESKIKYRENKSTKADIDDVHCKMAIKNIENKHGQNTEKAGQNITLAGLCAVCWSNAVYYCSECRLVGYCCMSHMAKHWITHESLCRVLSNKLVQNEGYLFGSINSDPDKWRFVRIKTLESVKNKLQRNVLPYERDLLLFPRHCSVCYETRNEKLVPCRYCNQVWYCREKPDHILKSHGDWCTKLKLFSSLVYKQANGTLFMFDMNFGPTPTESIQFSTHDSIATVIRQVLGPLCDTSELDDCNVAMISQAVSGPLTMLYALRMSKYKVKKNLTIHMIGAELHYEGHTLQAWHSFFLHFLPEIVNLRIVMVGPELNATKICETLSLCEQCRMKNRTLKFAYEDGLLYHEYYENKNFSKPDIVCAFNPGLHRSTGFNQEDTWPQTIRAALSNKCPFIFTAYTSYEAPLDLKRVQDCEKVHVVLPTCKNPYASLKPDRNFISDHEAPLIFKNYYMTIVTSGL